MKSGIEFRERHLRLYRFILQFMKGAFVHYFVLAFILVSIGAVMASSFESFQPYSVALFGITYFSSFVFLVEYVLRVIAAPAKYPDRSFARARIKYLFSFYGLVDFSAMLPFLLIYQYWDTPMVHIVILPYIFIIFKLIRYSRSFRIIGNVLGAVKEELVTAYTACGIMVCFSAILMYYIERNAQPEAFSNVGDGLWWAIVAFTTVGYGDIYPVTPLGKVLSSIISLIGIAMIAIPTGIITSAFMTMMQRKKKE